MNKRSVLIIYPGPVPPEIEPERNLCYWLSDFARGWFVQPIWWSKKETQDRLKLPPSGEFSIGEFKYKFIFPFEANSLSRPLLNFLAFIKSCRAVIKDERPDLIYTYGSNSTGIAGVVMKLLTGAKLVVMIPGVPAKAFILEESNAGTGARLKKLIADVLLYVCLCFADGIRLLYPTQLSEYRVSGKPKRFVFHDFTPVSGVKVEVKDNKRLLVLGYPWFLKGVDIAIKAFHEIEMEFPEYSLEVCGHCSPEDLSYFKSLTKDSERIILGKGVRYADAIQKLAECSVMVLPSRTEAMGRVNLEAFYLRKPIVASAVDGIPYYVRDRETGLLFRSGDHLDLAEKLRTILKNQSLREQLTENGYRSFLENYNEQAFAREFQRMVSATLA